MKLFNVILCLLFSTVTYAQSYTVSGTVKEAGSKELLPGITVYDSATKIGAMTNRYGFFSITLPQGKHSLKVYMLGYKMTTAIVDLKANLSLDILLVPASTDIATIEVTGAKTVNESEEVQMSSIDIPIRQIKDIPTFMGEKDVLKTIQLMPGVQSGSEGQSGIYVRGGGPDQNLIILDDAVVYNASHLFGFFSLFNGDALKSVELIKGGFPARYGGRLSSVIDMNMKEGNREKYTGELGIGVISSRGVFEGPLPGSDGKGSFVVAARRTYIDALIQPFILAASNGEETFGYFFQDINAKINYDLSAKDRLYLSGYFGKDEFYFGYKFRDEEQDGSLGWGNRTGTLRWNRVINEKTFSNTSFVASNFKLGVNSRYKDDFSTFELDFGSSITDYTLKYDLDYYPNPKHSIKAGAMTTWHRFSPNAIVIKGSDFPTLDHVNNTDVTESGVYIEDTYKPMNLLKINGGLRISHFTDGKTDYLNPEPRVSVAYSLQSDLALKGSYALMNQYVHLLSNTGIGLPTDLWVPATTRVKPQRSQQVALGLAKDFQDLGFSITLESYYKIMDNILGYKEGASFLDPDISGSQITFGDWQDKVTSGTGESYGLELFVQKKQGRFNGWIGYTLSWTQLQFDDLNNGKPYWAKYDRRHDISLVGIYKVNDGFKLSSTWVYGTGNAISLATSKTPGFTSIGRNSEDWLSGNAVYHHGEKNAYRMRAYHRWDIGMQFVKKKKSGNIRTWEISVYNAYNRANPFFYTTDTDDPDDNPYNNNNEVNLYQISLFPFLPSLSYSLNFN